MSTEHGSPPVKERLKPNTSFPTVARWCANLSTPTINSFSGAMAGMASGIVTCPLDVIKTKLQAQGSFATAGVPGKTPSTAIIYRGLFGTARTILRQDGYKGMYRGLGPMLLGYLPTWAVYMSVYDSSKDWFYTHHYGITENDKWLPRVYASLLAGAFSTIATNPIWVIKTRLMSQVSRTATDGARTPWNYTSTIDAARKMYRAEGLGAFYSGLAPALLGLTHVAIQFPLYEYFKQRITGYEMGEAPAESGKSWTNIFGILTATLLSKVCATSATYPHEVLRTRLQTQQRYVQPESSNGVQGSHHSQRLPTRPVGSSDGLRYEPRYKGVIRTFKVILREEGWHAFYNGMGTNMIRAVPAAMTTMLTFESVKGAIGGLQDEGKMLMREEEESWARQPENRKWS
ncbi:mitochondrial carrier domain-containing protein [Neohortaea acidophila]|uniref:Mitochondrial carrier domain-containing protein n=1 Tax=Neohortaea acidophila TaxID=245834 RepID=A0A6A6PLY9_9PEZI|nr:mitochondrial carrier domain-containing protein [Neohortaea acidophila]KAF2480277.1 mitochondrial carrier domain-containing protein [Neohortaea acidophila]